MSDVYREARRPMKKLTRRELELLTLTALGQNRSEIATSLKLSEETVKEYLERACRRLEAKNKTNATIIAFALGLIAPYGNTSRTKA
jgi:DNA-binding NarL/FixJ family response regulator